MKKNTVSYPKRKSNKQIDSYFSKVPMTCFRNTVVDSQLHTSDGNKTLDSEVLLGTKTTEPSMSYVAQKTCGSEINDSHTSTLDVRKTLNSDVTGSQPTEPSTSTVTIEDLSVSTPTHSPAGEDHYDIGLYVGTNTDKFTRFSILQNHWEPPKGYTFPFSVHNKGGKEMKRFLGRQHLESKHWLALSESHKGLYCKYCVHFSQEFSGHNKGVHLQSFVTKPVTSFAKLLGKEGSLESHERTVYHKQSVEAGKHFFKSYSSPKEAIVNKVITHRLQQVAENRQRLRPIIESIIFLGRQNIPFRGHRDDGQLLQEDPSPVNEGNFRELLRFRIASGDASLQSHLEKSSSRATYIGKNTQNSLIECCGEEIKSQILNRVKKAGCYSIIFDETTDLSHTQQLSLTLRYVHNEQLREDFITFIDTHENLQELNPDADEPKITGEMLGKIVLELVKQLSLNITSCVGIGTDSCSVMSSEIKGAVSEILKNAIHAVRSPCLNHCLNNSLSKSNSVQSIRNLVGTIKSVVEFFSLSAKRNSVLRSSLKQRNVDVEEFKGTQLPSLCETRWVERHEGVIKFKKALPYVIEALDAIAEWTDLNSASKANILRKTLCDIQFISSLLSLADILQHTLPLSKMLQAPSIDLKKATDLINDTISVLENKRKECDDLFPVIFSEVKELCFQLDVNIRLPRLVGRQQNRPNYPTSTPEDYFKKAIYIPLLDSVTNDLKSRFPKETLNCFGLSLLMPTKSVEECQQSIGSRKQEKEHLLKLVQRFSPVLGLEKNACVLAEFDLWRAKWEREQINSPGELPKTALEALDACDKDIYPSIFALLKIFSTLPVSVASAERSFSTLRRLKTWLRTRMGEERLCGLCLLHTHREIIVDVDQVIDRFANSGNRNRRLDFVV